MVSVCYWSYPNNEVVLLYFCNRNIQIFTGWLWCVTYFFCNITILQNIALSNSHESYYWVLCPFGKKNNRFTIKYFGANRRCLVLMQKWNYHEANGISQLLTSMLAGVSFLYTSIKLTFGRSTIGVDSVIDTLPCCAFAQDYMFCCVIQRTYFVLKSKQDHVNLKADPEPLFQLRL